MGLSVQYGCGFESAHGWLNFDSSPTLRFERIPLLGGLYTKNEKRFPKSVMFGDIMRGLPLAPDSVDRLYASHVLEHLPYEGAIKALANSFRILRSGGIFRLVVPDLHARAVQYVHAKEAGDASAGDSFMTGTCLGQRHIPQGLKERLSLIFGGSRHLWMWDELSMHDALAGAGFVSIRRCQFGDSGDPAFAEVENQGRFIDGDIVECAMECRKP